MDALYLQTNHLLHNIQTGLSRIENSQSIDMAMLAEKEVQSIIDQAISNCERLESLVNKEPATRRMNAKLQVDTIRYDIQHLQSGLRQLQHKRFRREEEEREREALLNRNFRPNDETSIVIDQGLDINNRMSTTNRRVDEMLDSGSNVLMNLKQQRATLKSSHRRLLDMVNTLGLSNTVMRLIERRSTQDKVIFFVGCAVTCILMFLIWRYYGR